MNGTEWKREKERMEFVYEMFLFFREYAAKGVIKMSIVDSARLYLDGYGFALDAQPTIRIEDGA